MWHGGKSSAKGGRRPSCFWASGPPCPVQGGFPLFCRGNAAVLNLADARLSPNRGADGAFPRRQAIHGELRPRRDCVRRGRCGVDGQSRVIQSGQNDRMSRGQLIDDAECYNPTLSCANLYFMLFRMNWIESGSARGPARKGNREGKKFFIWIRCNPLKRPDSTKGIQGNASLFPWFYLDLLGFIWPPSRTRVSAPYALATSAQNRTIASIVASGWSNCGAWRQASRMRLVTGAGERVSMARICFSVPY